MTLLLQKKLESTAVTLCKLFYGYKQACEIFIIIIYNVECLQTCKNSVKNSPNKLPQ
jgi:hypothetical protein